MVETMNVEQQTIDFPFDFIYLFLFLGSNSENNI